MDRLDRALVNRLHGDFPLTEHPYAEVGAEVGLSEGAVIERLERMLAARTLSRFGPLYDAEAMGGAITLAALAVPAAMGLSLATALLVHPLARWWKSLIRVCLFLPLISSAIALAIIWRALLTPGQAGPLNWFLGAFGLPPQNWLGHPDWVIPAIAAFQVWSGYGFWVIVLLAGLDAVPSQLYEAARVDGAGRWQLFSRITLPMLRPTLLFLSVMGVIWNLQLFDAVFILTQGGPANASVSVVYYIYRGAFHFDQLGHSATMSVLLFLLVMGLTLAQMRYGRRDEDAA